MLAELASTEANSAAFTTLQVFWSSGPGVMTGPRSRPGHNPRLAVRPL